MRKVLVAGAGLIGTNLVSSLSKKLDDEVIVIDNESVGKKLQYGQEAIYTLDNPYYPNLPEIKAYGESKPFVCKGKHEYRKVNNEWICQCTKKL